MNILGIIASAYHSAAGAFKRLFIGSKTGQIAYTDNAITWSTGQNSAINSDWVLNKNFTYTNSVALNSIETNGSIWIVGTNDGIIKTSTDLVTWTTRTSNMGVNPINGISYGNNIWVLGGSVGQIRRSTDGTTWTTVTSNFGTTSIFHVKYGNGVWVALGYTGQIRRSTDGTTWTTVTSNLGTTSYEGDLTFSSTVGKFIAAGGAFNQGLRSSTDGTTWVTMSIPYNHNIYAVGYGNGFYLAGLSDGSAIFRSTDGTTWVSTATYTNSNTIRKFNTNSNNNVVALASGAILNSTDSITWKYNDNIYNTMSAYGITNYQNKTVIVGNTADRFMLVSDPTVNDIEQVTFTTSNINPNGKSWSKIDIPLTTTVRGIDYGNGLWVAVGFNQARSSTDLTTWTTISVIPDSLGALSVGYGNGLWIVGGYYGHVRKSTDGATWTTVTGFGSDYTSAVLYANGKWIAGGLNAVIRESTDGTTWTTNATLTGSWFRTFAYGNGVWVAGASSGRIFSSTDAITWTTRTSNVTGTVNSIAYGNSKFIAGTSSGKMSSSTDGITWTTITGTIATQIQNISYTNNLWIAVGTDTYNSASISTDGVTWTTQYLGTNAPLYTSKYANNTLLVGGDPALLKSTSFGLSDTNSLYYSPTNSGLISTSTDGIVWGKQTIDKNGYPLTSLSYGGNTSTVLGQTWQEIPKFTWPNNRIMSLAYGNNLYVAGDDFGSISTSTNGTTWTSRYGNNGTTGLRDQTWGIKGIVYNGSSWVALARDGWPLTSTDAITWTSNTRVSGAYFTGLEYGNSTYAAGGSSGYIWKSTNSTTWTSVLTPLTGTLYKVRYKNNKWFAMDWSGPSFYESTDLTTWVSRTPPVSASSYIYDIEYNSGTYLVASTFALHSSTDLITWTSYPTLSIVSPQFIKNSGNVWYVGTYGSTSGIGVLFRSTDLVTWTTHITPKRPTFWQNSVLADGTNLFFSNGYTSLFKSSATNTSFKSFDVASTNSLVFQSTDFITWTTNTVTLGSDLFGSTTFTSTLSQTILTNSINVANSKIGYSTSNGLIIKSLQGVDNFGTFNTISNKLGKYWYKGTYNVSTATYPTSLDIENSRVISAGQSSFRYTTDLITWTSVGLSNVNAVTYGNGTYVGVASDGVIKTSTDLSTWTTRTSNFGSSSIATARYSGGLWVAVGAGGSVRTSGDGSTWTTRTSGVTFNLNNVRYINSRWVATGDNGLIHSADGTTWTSVSNPLSGGYPMDVAYGAGRYVIGKYGNTSPNNQYPFASSTNLTTWTTSFLTVPYGYPSAASIVYANNIFIATGDLGGIAQSTDGITWSHIAYEGDLPNSPWRLAYGNINGYDTYIYGSRYYEIYSYSSNSPILPSLKQIEAVNSSTIVAVSNKNLYTSFDGINYTKVELSWTKASNTETSSSADVLDGGAHYVSGKGFNFLSNNGTLLYSTDAITWTSSSPLPSILNGSITKAGYDIYYGNGYWVATGKYGTFVKSTDSVTWTSATIPNFVGKLHKLRYLNNLWIATGPYAQLHTSTDLVTWTSRDSKLYLSTSYNANFISSINYLNGKYIIGGQNNSVVSSTDTVTWTRIYPNNCNSNNYYRTSIEAGSKYYIAGANIKESTDLTFWSPSTAWFTTEVRNIKYNSTSGLYVSTHRGGQIFTSTDFTTWTSRTSNVTGVIDSLANSSTLWVAGVYSNSAIIKSTDGTTWTSVTSNFGATNVRGLAYGNGLFVAVGNAGQIRTSTDGTTWTTVTTSNFGVTNVLKVAYGNSLWIAAGDSGQIRKSTDASTWTTVTSNITSSIWQVGYLNGKWVASSVANLYLTSTDGTTWTSATMSLTPDKGTFELVTYPTYGASKYVIGAYLTTSPLRTSTDAITWTTISNVNASDMQKLWYANSSSQKWFATTPSDVLFSSTDAITWTTRITSYPLYDVKERTSDIISVGYGPKIYKSTDGITWTTITAANNDTPYSVIYGNSTTAYGSSYNRIYLQVNGQDTNPYANWYNNGFVAGDNGTAFMGNSDATSFRGIITGISDSFSKSLYNGSTYMLVGANATYTSTDTITWTTTTTNIAQTNITNIASAP